MTLEEFIHENEKGFLSLQAYGHRHGFSDNQIDSLCDGVFAWSGPLDEEFFAKVANPSYSPETMCKLKALARQYKQFNCETSEEFTQRFARLNDRWTLAILEN